MMCFVLLCGSTVVKPYRRLLDNTKKAIDTDLANIAQIMSSRVSYKSMHVLPFTLRLLNKPEIQQAVECKTEELDV